MIETHTSEILIELWIARVNLSVEGNPNKGEDGKFKPSGTKVPVGKTWSDYCEEIGSSRQTIKSRDICPELFLGSIL